MHDSEETGKQHFTTQNSSALNILQTRSNSRRHLDFNHMGKQEMKAYLRGVM